jgi:hypothetical protein
VGGGGGNVGLLLNLIYGNKLRLGY